MFYERSEGVQIGQQGWRQSMAERGLFTRTRIGLLLVGSVGILFAAAIVCEKQRVWQLAQPSSLNENYAEEIGVAGLSAAQRLAALRKKLDHTALELQGSDRASSRAIRREEALVQSPNAGVEQGASNEWAAGGAQAEWAAGGAMNLAQHELSAHSLLAGDGLAGASQLQRSSVLSKSEQLLARDIQRQEQFARESRLSATPDVVSSAQAEPVFAAAPPAWPDERQNAPVQAQARAQLLSQVSQGIGAVYAPSVMTQYQQQMLQSYMGAPTINLPPAVRDSTGPAQQLQGGNTISQSQWQQAVQGGSPPTSRSPLGNAPPPQLHGAALAAAWKAYLDPESVRHEKIAASSLRSSASQAAAASTATSTSQLARVGKAVVNVAVDSDGVLKHAESIMSSVKVLLAKPLADLTHRAKPRSRAALTEGEAEDIARAASEGAVQAALNQEQQNTLQIQLAAAKATHEKLEQERARLLASASKKMASSGTPAAPTKSLKNAGASSAMGSARTQLLVGVTQAVSKQGRHANNASHANNLLAKAVLHFGNASAENSGVRMQAPGNLTSSTLNGVNMIEQGHRNHSLSARNVHNPATVIRPAIHESPKKAQASMPVGSKQARNAQPRLPVSPSLVSDTVGRDVRSMSGSGHGLETVRSGVAVLPGSKAVMARRSAEPAVTRRKAERAHRDSVSPSVTQEAEETPVINVDIHDSKIDGGLHISRNTGVRKGAGAQSGCGALCQLGKLVQSIQHGKSLQALSGSHVPPALARAGHAMVERDYVIAHVEGQPVYAREMVPANVVPANMGVGGGADEMQHSRESSFDSNQMEGSPSEVNLERAIENEDEHADERRARRRQLRRDGEEWEEFERRRRAGRDGERAGAGDMRTVLSRGDMDHLASEVGDGVQGRAGVQGAHIADAAAERRLHGGEGDARKGGDEGAGYGRDGVARDVGVAPVKYKAVHFEIPVPEYEALTGQTAPGTQLVPHRVLIDETSGVARTAVDEDMDGL